MAIVCSNSVSTCVNVPAFRRSSRYSTPRISPFAPGAPRRLRSGMQIMLRMLCATMDSERCEVSALSVSVMMYSPAVLLACSIAECDSVLSSVRMSPEELRPTAS